LYKEVAESLANKQQKTTIKDDASAVVKG